LNRTKKEYGIRLLIGIHISLQPRSYVTRHRRRADNVVWS
jgi:hypothetical protein